MAIIDGKIRCSSCETTKVVTEFLPSIVKRGSGLCKVCRNVIKKANYQKNRDTILRQCREYRERSGPEKLRKIRRAQLDRNPDRRKCYALRKYGIRLAQYNEMLLKQDSKCAICKTDKNIDGKKFYVDHDHESGKVRGLLCRKCNTGLGLLGDNIRGISKVVSYLYGNAV